VELYRRKGTKFWLADFTVDGKRYRQSTGATTRARATEVAAELIEKAKKEKTEKQEAREEKAPPPLLRDFADGKFLPYVRDSQLDPDTRRYYQNGWRLLKDTPIAQRRIDEIVTSDAEVLQLPGSGSNANCGLRTLRRILSLAKDKRLLASVPKIKLREEAERSATFTPEQEQAFLAVAPQPLRDVFTISQDTGLRPDEVVRMRWENVLWDKNLIFNPNGKTKKSRRHVPLSDRVRNLLRVRADSASNEWVFPSPRRKGSPMSYFPVAKDFTKTRMAAGLPDSLVLYSARHSFATDMLDRTGNLILVQKLLGHEAVTTTQRYLHPELKGIAELVNERNAERAETVRHRLRHSGVAIQ